MSDKQSFDSRLQRAFAILQAAGVKKSRYAPPMYRLFWKCGLKVPPPQLAGFAINTLLMGAFFTFGWGLSMWLLLWGRQGMHLQAMAIASAGAGLLFGVSMATYMTFVAGKLRLPRWSEI